MTSALNFDLWLLKPIFGLYCTTLTRIPSLKSEWATSKHLLQIGDRDLRPFSYASSQNMTYRVVHMSIESETRLTRPWSLVVGQPRRTLSSSFRHSLIRSNWQSQQTLKCTTTPSITTKLALNSDDLDLVISKWYCELRAPRVTWNK